MLHAYLLFLVYNKPSYYFFFLSQISNSKYYMYLEKRITIWEQEFSFEISVLR